ncbi:septum site-determining protein MinC [Orenia metallireducens]|jgi:septum site-determining protein MinC|uniref:Probable septum site-determining protein MinC n=1 Tax=Orenia metallireducens TaxID=1413210 RepID=A0A1C0A578_9FIRM|nr:septum site-determining protein MinC [Orenia metallireducens]OCL25269.1 septum site-determining protein MinC [Orenia metallireducens]
MLNRGVTFKGDLEGLIIILNDELEFDYIKDELRSKFIEAGDFFDDDMMVRIKLGRRGLTIKQKNELLEIFKEQRGISVIEFINNDNRFVDSKEEGDTLLVKRTIRSGQTVRFEGNIVVLGDVNPGAEIVAEGDIVVMGHFRGIAHAGAKGDTSATISAFRLEPTQLRIANYITRAPDIPPNSPDTPEIASLKDKHIIIDYLRK